jgi:hypothetical protein
MKPKILALCACNSHKVNYDCTELKFTLNISEEEN